MLGSLHEWSFAEHGSRFTVAWWPTPKSMAFDTAAFVDALHALVHAAVTVFDTPPAPAYWLLVQDATDALEHRASVTIGVPSAELARNPSSRLTEIAHELFHSWNLVAIHPDSYGALRFTPTPPTTGLWWGEGVTMHYADVLPRRAGLVDSADTRTAHMEELLERYYGAPWLRTVSPDAASLAFGQSALVNPNATGGYYLQGELLGEVLDAAIRDATHEARTIDDVMRRLFAESDDGRAGFTPAGLQQTLDNVCSCKLDGLFASMVHKPGVIDLRPAMARLGWRISVDTVVATGRNNTLLPDLRVTTARLNDSTVAIVLMEHDSPWTASGLHTGDRVRSINGSRVSSFFEFYDVTRRLRVGDTAQVLVDRDGRVLRIGVPMTSYRRPRVRLLDVAAVAGEQRARRARWLAGW
jgi:predicted metalloprotease with PDZ domain